MLIVLNVILRIIVLFNYFGLILEKEIFLAWFQKIGIFSTSFNALGEISRIQLNCIR